MIPLFVELCAGTAALSLRLQGGPRAKPPVSRMGSKTGYSAAILRCLGLRSGSGAERYLWCEPDPGCRLLLTAYTDAELRRAAAEIIRGWKDEDPRALWERLRAEGPVKAPEAREVAVWCFQQSRAPQGHGPGSPLGIGFIGSREETPDGSSGRAQSRDRTARNLLSTPTLPASIHPDAREVDPREVARWCWITQRTIRGTGGFDGPNKGHVPLTAAGLAHRFSSMASTPAVIAPDARPIQPANLPPGSIVYIDPPYVNTTGYANDLPRDDVVDMARRWRSAGSWVVISEAEPISELSGWYQVEITGERIGQKRTFSKQQREFLTMNRPPLWKPAKQATLF